MMLYHKSLVEDVDNAMMKVTGVIPSDLHLVVDTKAKKMACFICCRFFEADQEFICHYYNISTETLNEALESYDLKLIEDGDFKNKLYEILLEIPVVNRLLSFLKNEMLCQKDLS